MSTGKGVSSHTHTSSQMKHHANQKNPNNRIYRSTANNHSNQLNPNNSEYRGER